MPEKLNRRLRAFGALLFGSLKSALWAGALVLAPLGITIWVFLGLVGLADGVIDLLPVFLRPETYLGFPIPGLGVLLTLVLVAGVGYALRFYTGRRVVELYEAVFRRLPVLSSIYNGLKQLIETLFLQKGSTFRQAVLVEYPRRGIWCLAFLTNDSPWLEVDGEGLLVSVFLPTTPNPTSGFYLLLPVQDVLALEVSAEDAFKLIMSAGIVTPELMTRARPLHVPDARDASGGGDGPALALEQPDL